MLISKRYWFIAKRLSTAQLQKGASQMDDLSESDLFNMNIGKRGNSFFLGYYSLEGIKLAFEKYGIIESLRKSGFDNILYKMDTGDPFIHRLSLYDGKQAPETMLAEVVLRKNVESITMPFDDEINGKKFSTLTIEWLSMQNPRAQFIKQRPRMPGQTHPGLGLASKIVEILLITVWRLGLAGLINIPDHYHNANLYSRIFFYIDPEMQARLIALGRDTAKYSLYEIAWAIEWGALLDKASGKPAEWVPSKQVVPMDSQLKKFFNSKKYRKYVKEKAKIFKYELDYDEYKRMKNRRSSK